jgi:general secretion pathway protein H
MVLRVVKTSIVILPVGKDNRGFSLVELVVVLLLIGVSMAIVAPNIAKGLQDREVRVSALSLAAVARDLRSQALFDGVPQQLVVNLPQNSYLVRATREVRLPSEVKFVSVDGGEAIDRDSRRFSFSPTAARWAGRSFSPTARRRYPMRYVSTLLPAKSKFPAESVVNILSQRRCASGFTLLEVLVAMTILGLGVVTLLQIFSQGLQPWRAQYGAHRDADVGSAA